MKFSETLKVDLFSGEYTACMSYMQFIQEIISVLETNNLDEKILFVLLAFNHF